MWLQDFLRWLLFPEGLPTEGGATIPPPFPQIVKVTSSVGTGVARITKGTYAGNGANPRAIVCGFAPQAVLVQDTTTGAQVTFAAASDATITLTATGFNALGSPANTNAHNYAWVAYAGAA